MRSSHLPSDISSLARANKFFVSVDCIPFSNPPIYLSAAALVRASIDMPSGLPVSLFMADVVRYEVGSTVEISAANPTREFTPRAAPATTSPAKPSVRPNPRSGFVIGCFHSSAFLCIAVLSASKYAGGAPAVLASASSLSASSLRRKVLESAHPLSAANWVKLIV